MDIFEYFCIILLSYNWIESNSESILSIAGYFLLNFINTVHFRNFCLSKFDFDSNCKNIIKDNIQKNLILNPKFQ